ncbi:MAG TPA: PEP-CTERM sorting domain-containing protein [Lacipirellulaceae bacterium]|nr:PEP-CTERM sorting domain-containing protein [Lacipirellulaceae bacterium]
MFSKKIAIACAAAAALSLIGMTVQAAPTWTALIDQSFPGFANGESYSLRGIATSPDGRVVYGSWLHTGTGKEVVEYNASSGAVLNSTYFADQAKSLAVDDRGYVFAGTGNDNGDTPFIQALSADLQTSYDSVTAFAGGVNDKRFGGLATWDDGGNHYVYATRESSHFYIQRFLANDVNDITLDTTFGTGGTLSLTGGYLHGLAVAPDGTIYAASTNEANAPSAANGTVYKISADGTSATSTNVAGAFDLALYGNNLYVSEYGAGAPGAVAVLDASTLAGVDVFNTGFSNTNTSFDSGYSGIDISPQGNIYLADQFHSSSSYSDRLLVSSAVPEPSSLALLVGLVGLALSSRRPGRNEA